MLANAQTSTNHNIRTNYKKSTEGDTTQYEKIDDCFYLLETYFE